MKRIGAILLVVTPFLFACKKNKTEDPSGINNTSCDHGWLRLGDTSSYITFPTAFTPNGDGLNDLFTV